MTEQDIDIAVAALHKLNRNQQESLMKIIKEVRRLQGRVKSDDIELERLYRENERMASPSYWT
jgi:hypothetical protein